METDAPWGARNTLTVGETTMPLRGPSTKTRAKSRTDIAPELIREEEQNVLSVTIGAPSTPYETNKEPSVRNYDDFDLSDFVLQLPDGRRIDPTAVRTYRAVDKATPADQQNTVEEVEYAAGKNYALGDGSAGSNLKRFYRLDLIFDVPKFDPLSRVFYVDTTELADGEHQVSLTVEGTKALEAKAVIDNTAPVTLPVRLSLQEMKAGFHTLEVRATDQAGNRARKSFLFELSGESMPTVKADHVLRDNEVDLRVTTPSAFQEDVTVRYFQGAALPFTVSSGQSDTIAAQLNVDQAKKQEATAHGITQVSTDASLPYVLYDVEVKKQKTVLVSADVETATGDSMGLGVVILISALLLLAVSERSKRNEKETNAK